MAEPVQGLDVLSVSEVTQRVKAAIEGASGLQNIWMKGEISNFRQPSSGHLYFTLKDAQSRMRAVMFRSKAQSLAFRLEDGLTVLVRGSVGLYEAAGEYQFYVEEVVPAGQGALYLAFEQLKARLEQEGLFAQKRPLPFFPKTVGLITSPTGAAVRDMISVIRRRNPAVNVLLIPAVVQGEEAVPSLCQAIEVAQRCPGIDVLIIGRGGGSLEELWAFNEEPVARAIFRSRIPTISAVGHETDFTIADFVADFRAPTPSAAAEVAVPELRVLRSSLADLRQRAAIALRRRAQHYRERLRLLERSAALTQPDRQLREHRQRLDDLLQRAEESTRTRLERLRHRLHMAVAKLDSLSPLATLSRGYAICLRPGSGQIVRDADEVADGERLLVKVARGEIPCRVARRRGGPKATDEAAGVEQARLPIEC